MHSSWMGACLATILQLVNSCKRSWPRCDVKCFNRPAVRYHPRSKEGNAVQLQSADGNICQLQHWQHSAALVLTATESSSNIDGNICMLQLLSWVKCLMYVEYIYPLLKLSVLHYTVEYLLHGDLLVEMSYKSKLSFSSRDDKHQQNNSCQTLQYIGDLIERQLLRFSDVMAVICSTERVRLNMSTWFIRSDDRATAGTTDIPRNWINRQTHQQNKHTYYLDEEVRLWMHTT